MVIEHLQSNSFKVKDPERFENFIYDVYQNVPDDVTVTLSEDDVSKYSLLVRGSICVPTYRMIDGVKTKLDFTKEITTYLADNEAITLQVFVFYDDLIKDSIIFISNNKYEKKIIDINREIDLYYLSLID